MDDDDDHHERISPYSVLNRDGMHPGMEDSEDDMPMLSDDQVYLPP